MIINYQDPNYRLLLKSSSMLFTYFLKYGSPSCPLVSESSISLKAAPLSSYSSSLYYSDSGCPILYKGSIEIVDLLFDAGSLV